MNDRYTRGDHKSATFSSCPRCKGFVTWEGAWPPVLGLEGTCRMCAYTVWTKDLLDERKAA